MDTGMLWFDDSDRTLETKIQRAATYYTEKYEKKPNLCVVHPSMLPNGELLVDKIAVRQATAVMPHHYWIGIHEAEAANGRAKGKPRKAA
jgi:hypothetical protein